MSRRPEVLLLAFSCLCCAIAVETFFYFLAQRQQTYPAVWYHTDDERTKLLCYDEGFLGVADWDLRLDHPYGTLRYAANTDEDSSLQDLDPRLVPHAVEFRVNEAGFRERPLAQVEAATTLVIGDSFGAGQGVRISDRLSERLEARLKPEGPNHVIANFCMLGYNIRDISKTMGRHLDTFPNLQRVIYILTLNDPLGDARALEMYQVIDDLMHLRTNLLAESAAVPVLSRSHAARWMLERVARREISRTTVERYNYLFDDNVGWRRTRQLLDRMRDRCEQKGCEFIIVLFPLLFELADYPFKPAHEAVRAYARGAGIGFIDLLELFAGADERTYRVHPRDFHPNDRAHRKVAEYLYGEINWDRERSRSPD